MDRALFGIALLGALQAHASASFPSVAKDHLSLAQPPPCALCHTNGITGMGTVNTPVGSALRAEGLQAGSDTSLTSALDALLSAGTDSDGDGTGDIAELKAGRNPNVADGNTADGGTPATDGGSSTGTTPPPKFGCGANAAPGAGGLLALGALAHWLSRRRA
ncbi:MAG: hypothetical protein RL653_4261 [Pseudomonadota bacterium]|jgi:hypothetical protein